MFHALRLVKRAVTKMVTINACVFLFQTSANISLVVVSEEEAPIDISLTSAGGHLSIDPKAIAIPENLPAGSVIGTITGSNQRDAEIIYEVANEEGLFQLPRETQECVRVCTGPKSLYWDMHGAKTAVGDMHGIRDSIGVCMGPKPLSGYS